MSILDNAESHFKKIRDNDQVVIDVPEWGSKLIVKRGTVAEKEKFIQHFRNGELLQANIWTLIKRCLNEDGTRAFPNEQSAYKRLREKVDPEIIGRIASEIYEFDASDFQEIEDAGKN